MMTEVGERIGRALLIRSMIEADETLKKKRLEVMQDVHGVMCELSNSDIALITKMALHRVSINDITVAFVDDDKQYVYEQLVMLLKR